MNKDEIKIIVPYGMAEKFKKSPAWGDVAHLIEEAPEPKYTLCERIRFALRRIITNIKKLFIRPIEYDMFYDDCDWDDDEEETLMKEHECIIGIFGDYENTDIITFSELKEEAKRNQEMVEYCKQTGYSCNTPYSLSDYLDLRKTTNFVRFKFCPYCGKEIDWKKLRSENKQ